jgi:hypothetical protein
LVFDVAVVGALVALVGLRIRFRRRRGPATLGAAARTSASGGRAAPVPPGSDTDCQASGTILGSVDGELQCDPLAPVDAAEPAPPGRKKRAKQSERYRPLHETVGDAEVATAPAAGGEEYVAAEGEEYVL